MRPRSAISGVLASAFLLPNSSATLAAELPIFEAHIQYSHDSRDVLLATTAIEILRKSGVRRARVSGSNDDGTQALLAEAPELVIPERRPYRVRGDRSTWVRDDSIIACVEERRKRHRYVAIGEFHVFGADTELPVPRRRVQFARMPS